MSDDHETSERSRPNRRVLSARVPLWTLLVAVGAVVLLLGAVIVMQRMNATSLGSAVAGAQEVDVRMVICNAEVDRREINPRAEELDLQETLTDHGAGQAQVRIERVDCPPPAG
ncbi:MAG TPA: hypothetical protein VM938_15500 [Acidimicrobiales bacterium]|nr:hypothetical protein [Acidimicrobiales bacterium]